MTDSLLTRHSANKTAWNEAAAFYETEIDVDIAFLKAGGKNLWEPELRILHDLTSWCHRLVHLQCAGGRDTLSLWNHGAAQVVGVDISERMIECARRKSEALGAPAEWYCSDVLDTPHSIDGTADLVYTGRGALCWLMDIDAWAAVVKRLLKPNGRVYIFEGHPLDWVWKADASTFELEQSYFSGVEYETFGWPAEYIPESEQTDSPSPKYEHQWTLGAIVTALANTGLRLERLEEHPHQYWECFPQIPANIASGLPHTFSLLMRNSG